MNPILVTTDLSPETYSAFSTALELAKALGAPITLLSVVEDPNQAAMFYATDFPIPPTPSLKNHLVARVRSDLLKLAQEQFNGIKCETDIREATGPIYSEILAYAEQIKAHLIVVSTHGRTGLGHLLIGSTAERIARESKIPVVIVPAHKVAS